MNRMACLVALLAPICGLSAQTRPLFAWPLERGYLPVEAGPSEVSVVGDVNGDGNPDLLIAENGLAQVYFNDGRGSFSRAPWVGTQAVGTNQTMALVDVNCNGHLDLILIDRNIGIHLNDGNGRFTQAQNLGGGFVDYSPPGMATGDLDGDGYPDLVVAFGRENRVYFYFNDGTGRFIASGIRLPYRPSLVRSVAIGDVNGNGHLDIVVGTTGENVLYLNDGMRNFTAASAGHLPPLEDNTWDVALVDVDRDGHLDLVCANRFGPIRLLLNDGQGRFTDVTATHLPPGNPIATRIWVGDLDRDGASDLLFTAGEAYGLEPALLYRNDGRGRFRDATGLLPGPPSGRTLALHPVDLDWDGDLDIVAVYKDQPVRVFLYDGRAGFTHANPQRLPAGHVRLAADFTGNGHLDLYADGLSIGDGSGWFKAADPGTYPGPSSPLAAGDLTGNGALDLIALSAPLSPLALILWENDGRGRFTEVFTVTLEEANFVQSVTLGDVDGDGELDLLAVYDWIEYPSMTMVAKTFVFPNQGQGRFFDPGTARLIAVDQWNATTLLADLDGDGDLDIMIASPDRTRLFLNDGKGDFTEVSATHLPPGLAGLRQLQHGDVTGNGAPDIFVAAGSGNRGSVLLLNDGQARFRVCPKFDPPTGGEVRTALLADLNGDGHLDLFLTVGQRAWGNFFLQGDGQGNFREIPQWLPAGVPFIEHALAVDIDGDGDLDILGTEPGSRRQMVPLINLTRQLHAPLLPRPGYPYRLDFHGDPTRHAALPLFGTGRASTPLGPLGTLQLATQGLHALSPVFLDSQGLGSLFCAVPRNPALYGAPLFFQALMVDRVECGRSRLTNLVKDEVVDV